MPMEPDSHTKGLAAVEEATVQSANSAHTDWRPFYPPEEEAIRNQISTQSTKSSPASASTVGVQTESIHRDIPPASSISRADDRTHDRSQSPSSLANMKEEAPLA
jgi:predicted component of type VI protein secretion system